METKLRDIIKEQKPYLKESSISQYAKSIERLHTKIETYKSKSDDDYENEPMEDFEFIKDADMVENALADISFTTRRNYYSAIITLLQAEEVPEKVLIKKYSKIVKDTNEKYVEENKTRIISKKQQDKLVKIEKIDFLLEILQKEGGMNYIIFKLLSIYHLRNEIATLQLIDISVFNKLTKKDKENKNYLVIGTKRLYISRNDYKTDKKYGEIIVDIDDKEFQKEFRDYISTLDDDIVFPYNGEPMTKKRLTNHLTYHSKRIIGVGLSTTMLAKSILSHKYYDQTESQQADANIRGHSVSVMNEVYVKKLPDAMLPEDIGNKEFSDEDSD